jgi:hypothetical protein
MMKKRIILPALVFTFLAVFGCEAYVEGPRTAPAWHPASVVEISFFYDSLAPYGDWLWVDPWGWVWTPWDVEPGWRPYTRGHWVWTSLGWTWVSDWPWGWAPFHYGRWTYDLYHGWIWIPDRVWAPAWVAWRSGHGWIGWAPLPPGARWQIGIGLDLGGVDLTLGIVHHSWSFVHERHFLEPRVWRHLEPLPRNAHRLRETEDRTRYEEVDRQVAVRGIGVEEIERSAGSVRRYPVEDVAKPPRGVVGGAAPVERPPARQAEPGRAPAREGTPPAAEGAPPAAEEGAPPQPPPSLDRQPAERRTAAEQRALRAWEEQQRQRLDEEQRQERRQKPPSETVVELERRQQEERRAFEKEVEREKQLVENRRDRRAQEQAKAKESAKEPAKERKPKPKKPPERER